MSVLRCVTFHLLCRLSEYTVIGTAFSPTSTTGMLAVHPGTSQALFSQCHQRRSTEVRSQDCSSRAPGPAVGAMEAAQTLARPSLLVYTPTMPIAAKARHVPAMGAPVFCSDVLQALNLQSWQRRCNSAVRSATGRDFSSAS